MPLKFKRNSQTSHSGVLTVVFLVVSLVCFFAYTAEGSAGPVHSIQSVFSAISAPFQQAGAAVGTGINNAATAVSDGSASEESLSALREQNQALRQQLAEMEEYRQEALRLESLLMVKSSLGVDGISATVVGRSGEAYSQTITISAGSNDGVDVGQTVMGSTGVVGQIISVSENTSVVRLLSDPQSGAAAIIQSSRDEGIIRGSLDGLLYLEDLDSDAEVNVGDVVLTSGQGGSYISGLIIGTVVRVDDTQDVSSQKIIVSPNDSFSSLQNVVVVNSTGNSTAAVDALTEGADE